MKLNFSWENINKQTARTLNRTGITANVMTQTVSLVHVNIYLVLTVHLRWSTWLRLKGHHLTSTASPQFRKTFWWTVRFIQFSSCVEIFSLAEGTPLAECSFDSDWILRTLSPSNESSKDLNLQRINMNFIVPWWTATFSEQSVQKWTVCSDSNGD